MTEIIIQTNSGSKIIQINKEGKKYTTSVHDGNKQYETIFAEQTTKPPYANQHLIKNLTKNIYGETTNEGLQYIQKEISKRKDEIEPKEKHQQNHTQTSTFYDGGKIYEQIYTKEKGSQFCYLENGEIKYTTNINGIHPLEGEELGKKVILLPTHPEDYISDLELMREIETHINKYLDISPNYKKIAAYYIMMSWLYDKLETIPYLRALGDTGGGKSRFLKTIGGLCYKATNTAGTATPAVIFRLQEKWKGTLLIDEADRRQSDTSDEIVKILNCGFEKGLPVIRIDKDNGYEITSHSVYGPKIITSRYSFYDKALEARCLTHVMQETEREDIIPVLGKTFYKEEMEIRNKLLMFRLCNYNNTINEFTHYNMVSSFEPRLRQVISSLLQVFEGQEDILEDILSFMDDYKKEIIEERANTFEGNVIAVIKELKSEGAVHITPTLISDRLNLEGTQSKKVTPRYLGRILKALGIRVILERVAGVPKRVIQNDDILWNKLLKRYDPEFFEFESVTL